MEMRKGKNKNERGLKATLLASSEKYTLNGKPVETERFRAEEQGPKFYELLRTVQRGIGR